MTNTNETGGILKEKAKKWRGATKAMNIDVTAPKLNPTTLLSERQQRHGSSGCLCCRYG